jgi:hypothetical protein
MDEPELKTTFQQSLGAIKSPAERNNRIQTAPLP